MRLRIPATFIALSILLAACGPGRSPPPGVSTDLPDPGIVTRIAASRTAGPSSIPRQAEATTGPSVAVSASVLTRVRAGPGTTFDTVALLQAGEPASAIGRNPGGDWLLIEYSDEHKRGWIFAELAQVREGDLGSLPVASEVVAAPSLQAGEAVSPPPAITATPLPPGFPTPTPSATVVVAIEPEIGFYADTLEVNYKEPCTYLRWIARPVQAVYLDGESMAGRDFIAICPHIPSQTYTLDVVTLDGKHVVLELTVNNSGIP